MCMIEETGICFLENDITTTITITMMMTTTTMNYDDDDDDILFSFLIDTVEYYL